MITKNEPSFPYSDALFRFRTYDRNSQDGVLSEYRKGV
jgi:hypothetical protein